MKFHATDISGVIRIDVDVLADPRGFFARTWCAEELAAAGIDGTLAQCSISYNTLAGTLRGMHWQQEPWGETKIVRCTRGSIYDVALDLRADSPTRLQWIAVELSADNRRALCIPPGVAHGFQTLTPDSEVLYMISTPHHPEASAGVRWDDPAFAIEWPIADPILSERDATYLDFSR